MMLKASKHKKRPAIGLLGSTLYKNIGIIILMSIAMLIFCPGFFLAALSKSRFNAASYYPTPDALNALYGITGAFSCILVCIGNYVNFSYLYKKHSSDVFHALPLTRNSLMFSRAAAAFIAVLIPVTIGYAALLLLTLHYPAYIVGTAAQILSAYLFNVLLMLAASAFSLFFIICAGSAFDLALSFAGYNIAVLVIAGIINSIGNTYLSGYSNSDTVLFKALSPIFYIIECGYTFADKGYGLLASPQAVFGVIKVAAIFAAISAVLYNFRKAERGEQAYAYKFLYIICGILAGICGGYALSQIFIYGADAKELSAIAITAFVVGALITTVVYGAVSERGFKTFKKSMAIGLVSVAAYGIVFLIIMTGAFGFEKRIPESGKISAVTVNFDEAQIDFKDPTEVIALHKAILEKGADDDIKEEVEGPHTYIDINYNLSGEEQSGNGDFMRSYFVDKTKIKKELFAVYNSDARFEQIKAHLKSVKAGKIEVWGDNRVDDFVINGVITEESAENLLSVYRKELTTLGEEYFSVEKQENIIMDVRISFDTDNDNYIFSIYTTSDFPETNEILSALREEPIDIKAERID